MALWRIPKMGAEGESGSVICESLRQKDSVKDTKRKATYRSSFLYFEWIMNNNSEQNLQRRRIVMEVSGPGDFPGTFFVGNAVLVSGE